MDVDLEELILSEAVPMKARMIHTAPTTSSLDDDDIISSTEADPSRQGINLLSQTYSTKGECINSVDRARLNNLLLDQALHHPGIDVYFDHKLLRADLEKAMPLDELASAFLVELLFEDTSLSSASSSSTREQDQKPDARLSPRGQIVQKHCDLVIGCDGHHSKLRSEMLRHVPRMDFSQSYIDSGYVELSIPKRSEHPSAKVREGVKRFTRIAGPSSEGEGMIANDDEFLLDPNHLHIWPRHDFMLIALPNRDGSFTCTLFAPFNLFRRFLTPKALLGDDGSVLMEDERADREDVQPKTMVKFFQEHFPDALPLISSEALVRDLGSRKPSNLGMISVNPYTYKERAVLLGDSAHAMVPFYGQGLNCGLEDVRVLLEWIDGTLPEEGQLARVRHQAAAEEVASLLSAKQGGDAQTVEDEEEEEESPISTPSADTAPASVAASADEFSVKTAASSATSLATPPEHHQHQANGKESPRRALFKLLHEQESQSSSSPFPQNLVTLNEVRHSMRKALNAYSSSRRADLTSISSLAIDNYREMSSKVVSPTYILRMKLDGVLMRVLPAGWWRSLYTMVTFSNERYSVVTERRDWQDDVVRKAVEVGITVAAVGIAAGSWAAGKWWLQRART